jgi:hypothetical protein
VSSSNLDNVDPERLKRGDVVLDNLDDAIRSADQLWIQLATGRASVYIPLGMRTMERRTAREKELETLLRDLDDLTIPQTMGNPIPPSATQEPERRATAAAALVAKMEKNRARTWPAPGTVPDGEPVEHVRGEDG